MGRLLLLLPLFVFLLQQQALLVAGKGLRAHEIPGHVRELIRGGNSLKLMTWNILYDIQQQGKSAWNYRKDALCQYIKTVKPMILDLQEVKESQLTFLSKTCLRRYGYVGRPFNDNPNPQYNPIFYQRTRYLKVEGSGTFWLSETPETPFSRLPGTQEARSATWIKVKFAKKMLLSEPSPVVKSFASKLHNLLLQATGKLKPRKPTRYQRRVMYQWKTLYVVNTHLEWRNETHAARQASVLARYMREVVMDMRKYPLIVTGDMNWPKGSQVSDVYRATGLQDTMLTSTRNFLASSTVNIDTGHERGYDPIDQIWASREFSRALAGTLMDRGTGDIEMSDHRAVLAVVVPK